MLGRWLAVEHLDRQVLHLGTVRQLSRRQRPRPSSSARPDSGMSGWDHAGGRCAAAASSGVI
jgi:hypothetical protein